MEKLLSLVLIVVFLLSLAGCQESAHDTTNQMQVNAKENIFDYDFHTYLNNIPFVEGMSQSQLTNQVALYKYEGESITTMMLGEHSDGLDGGGYQAFNRDGLFSYGSISTFYDNEGYVIHSDYFNTSVHLEGLYLPAEINFGDTIIDALEKLNVNIYAEQYTSMYDDSSLIIFKDEDETFKLNKTEDNDFSLVYTESYQSSVINDSTVTRKITMVFSRDNKHKLDYFSVSLDNKRPY